jgi:hypothetical protein
MEFYAALYGRPRAVRIEALSASDAMEKIIKKYPAHRRSGGEDIEMISDNLSEICEATGLKPQQFKVQLA